MQQGPELRDSNNTRPSAPLSRSRADARARTTHLGHGVLNRRSREQQPVPTLKLKQDFPPDAEMGETISSREPREFKLVLFQFLERLIPPLPAILNTNCINENLFNFFFD